MKHNFVGAADLGSAQFVVLAAAPAGTSWELAGAGKARARGYEEGRLTDIAAASKALGSALHEAELMAGGKIGQMITGISGLNLLGEDKQVAVRIQDGIVAAEDIERALETLRAFPIPQGMEILHIIQQFFSVDKHPGIRHPLGMTGKLLEADAHVISAGANALADIRACVEKADAPYEKSAASILASAMSSTTADERHMGVAVLDWGAGIINIAVYKDDALRGMFFLPLGGSAIDKDIARTFCIPITEAERVKKEIGSAVQVAHNPEQVMQVSDLTGEKTININAHVLSMSIEARADEALRALCDPIKSLTGKGELSAGAVFCGGCAQLKDLPELAHEVLQMPIRIGYPRYTGAQHEDVASPEFSVATGLLDLYFHTLDGGHLKPGRKGLWGRLGNLYEKFKGG